MMIWVICGILVSLPFKKIFSGTVFSTASRESSSISPSPDPHHPLSFTPMSTDLPSHSGIVGASDNPSDKVGPIDSASDNVGLIVAVTVGVLLLTLAVVGVPLMVIMVIRMRRKGKRGMHDVFPAAESSSG